jgi:hypothetical protein
MIRREKVNKKVDGQRKRKRSTYKERRYAREGRSKSKGTILECIGFKEKEQLRRTIRDSGSSGGNLGRGKDLGGNTKVATERV